MIQEVNTASHHGIASYWVDGEGLCTGTLTFGVGFRDEPATLAGITHLIEHVILRMVHPVTMPHGGISKVDSVEFYASGEVGAVAGFLNAVGVAVSDFASLTEEDLVVEKAVIQAEDPGAFHSASSGLLTYRFGAAGLGVAHFGAAATVGLSRSEVIEWARRWMTANNAALTFTGPLPDSLDVRLPPGSGVFRDSPLPVLSGSTMIKSAKAGVALSFTVPLRNAGLLGDALTHELLSRLQHPSGLIYSVTVFTTGIDSSSCQLDLILDPIESNLVRALQAGVNTVREVAAAGFSEDAVQYARSTRLTELGWDDSVPSGYLDQLAVDGLLGRVTPTRKALLDGATGVASTELTSMLAAGLGSLIVAVDKSVKVHRKVAADLELDIDPYEMWQPHRSEEDLARGEEVAHGFPTWRSKSSKAVLWLTQTHLMLRKPHKTKRIALADVVVVGDRSCGCISLRDQRGRTTEIVVDNWKGSENLRSRLLDVFPDEIIRPFPEE